MGEMFYQCVWQYRLFESAGLVTVTGERVEVINQGLRNKDAGPDFFNAQIKIEGTLWAGNIEIHTDSASWYQHGHDTDHAYDNVVLHVVAKSDGRTIVNANGLIIPEIEIRYPQMLENRYKEFLASTSAIHCRRYLNKVTDIQLNFWLERLLVERFEQRNERVERLFGEFGGDWNQVCFCLLARSLGGSVNGEQMELLARCTPVRLLAKHNDPLQMEALLLGQSGLLPESSDEEYVKNLRREYDFLKIKFGLEPMNGAVWKYLRLRPVNFPVIRISQLVSVVALARGNFESVFRTIDVQKLLKMLNVSASEYWDNHYIFGKTTDVSRRKMIGVNTRRLMIINAIIPFVFAYMRRYGNEREQQNIIKMLSFLPIEKNSKLDEWIACGITPKDEGEAQALLLLRKEYCDKKRCLFCGIGHSIYRS